MTQTAVPTDGHAPGPVLHKPAIDHDAVRANAAALKNFASKGLPGRQHEILDAVAKILTCVEPSPAAG